jgi:hypothetical protein
MLQRDNSTEIAAVVLSVVTITGMCLSDGILRICVDISAAAAVQMYFDTFCEVRVVINAFLLELIFRRIQDVASAVSRISSRVIIYTPIFWK